MFTWEIMSWLFKDPVVIMKEIMSWLFKDPIITSAWLNFGHAQSNSKKWPKKIKFPCMKFFLEKTTMYSPFHCAKFKKDS